MKTTHKVIAVSIGFGLFFWVVDAVLDVSFFHPGTLFELLITDVPAHEIYIRLVVMVCFLAFGMLLSGVIAKLNQVEEALRKSNRAYRILGDCNQALVRVTDEAHLLREICRVCVEVGGYRLAWVGFAEQDDGQSVRPVAQVGFEDGYLETLHATWADTERGRGPTGAAIRTGKAAIAHDIPTDPDFAPWRAEAVRRGYASSIALPLASGGLALGALNIYAVEPDAFDAPTVNLLAKLADDLAFGIVALRARAERQRAEEALRASEELFKTTFTSQRDAIFLLDAQSPPTILDCNPFTIEVFGFSRQEMLGRTTTFLHVDEAALRVFQEHLYPAIEVDGFLYQLEFRMKHKDGTIFFTENSVMPLQNERGERIGWVSIVRNITERKRVEEALAAERKVLQKRTHDLNERVKELGCLFAMSNLVEQQGILLEEIFEGVVDILPPAWQYPEITCARLAFDGKEFRTRNFEVTAWGQASDIIVYGEPKGAVQVYYLTEQPESDEGPFLKEERALLDAIAERLGKIIERMQAEDAVWQHAERLSTLYAIDQAILEAQSSEAIAGGALWHIGQLVPCVIATVTEFDLRANTAITLAQYHKAVEIGDTGKTRSLPPPQPLEGIQGIITELRRNKVHMTEDIQSLAPLPPAIQTLAVAGVRSFVSVPLIAQDELVGSLNLGLRHPAAFTPEHVEITREVAAPLAVALQQTRLYEQVERHAAELERRVADRTQELRTLYDVTAVASESLDLQVVLEQSLERTLAAVRRQAGTIHLLDEANGALDEANGALGKANGALEEKALQLAVQQGAPPYITALVHASAAGDVGLANWVIEHVRALVLSDMSDDVRVSGTDRALGPFPYAGVPMRVMGKMVGVLGVVGREGQQFSAEEVALLASVADHVATAVENARLRRQAERAIVIEERARLARELHDSVTQLLYSLGLYAATGLKLARSGETQGMADYLGRIGRAAQQALKEMRVLIYELRPPVLEEEGIVGALQQRLDAVERRAGVESILLAEGMLELPVTIESDLYYIAQEALNNVLKHAAATSVKVHLCASDEQVELVVTDNGAGFDPDSAGGMGLIGMRERAAKMGGELTIHSTPKQGTRVKVLVRKKQKTGTSA